MEPPREVVEYYDRVAEESRLNTGPSHLEFERTKELITRVLPVFNRSAPRTTVVPILVSIAEGQRHSK